MNNTKRNTYLLPFILVTTLFFLWGFARSILDVLNKHFQELFSISISQSAWVQVMTYLAYFLMAVPAGMFNNRFGYRKGVVFGLGLFGIGALLFIPGSMMSSGAIFYAFLVALFVLSSGLAFLETAANPYVTELGDPRTATSRLNLSQTFNGLGSCIAPALVGGYLFSGGSVTQPYLLLGILVLLIALVFSFVKLPEIKTNEPADALPNGDYDPNSSLATRLRLVWRHKIFLFGLVALLAYEIAEISINSYFINYTTMPHVVDGQLIDGLLSPNSAAVYLSAALFLFMIGRFVGAGVMTFVRAERVLLCCALGSIVSIGLVFLLPGKGAIYALMANYLFESIMFPTIFSLALRGMGSLTKTASSLLMMTPVGGCAFLLTGYIAEAHMLLPFAVPFVAFILIFLFAYTLLCRKGIANEE